MVRRATEAAAVVLIVALTAGVQVPRAAAQAGPTQERSFAELSRQGQHYLRLERYEAAMEVLERARALPEGRQDFMTHHSLARAYYELLHLEKAFPVAREALLVAGSNKDHQQQAERLLGSLNERFAGVTFRRAPEQRGPLVEGVIHLKDRGGLINPKKKKLFHRIAQRLRDNPVRLPVTVYLPFGSYTGNGTPFDVAPGETAEVELFVYAPGEEPSKVMTWPVWTTGGATLAAAALATTFYVLAVGEHRQARDLGSTPGADRDAWDRHVDASDRHLLAANLSLGAAGLLAATTGALLAFNLLTEPEPPGPATETPTATRRDRRNGDRLTWELGPGPRPAGISLLGRF